MSTRKPSKPKRKPYRVAGKTTIKDWDGYAWRHVATVDEAEANRLKLFYTRAKKDFKIVKDKSAYAVFVRKE
jgi:hypothetical protein